MRTDLVQVPVADQPGDNAGVPVRNGRQGAGMQALRIGSVGIGQRHRAMVAGQHGQTARLRIHFRQPRFQPFQLRCAYAALAVTGRVVGVEQDDARVFGIYHRVGNPLGRMVRRVPERATLQVGCNPLVFIDRAPGGQRLDPARRAL